MTTAHRTTRRLAPVAALAVVMAAGAPVTASAAAPFSEHWNDDFTVVHPAGSEDFCDLPFDVVEHVQEIGSFVGVNRGPSGLFYGGARFKGTITWTNPANGRNYRDEYAGSDRDAQVSDSDGMITLQVRGTGPHRYYDNGTLAFIDTGMVLFTITFDDGGTPTDPNDDGEAQFVSLDRFTGLRQTDGRDFCADIIEFLG